MMAARLVCPTAGRPVKSDLTTMVGQDALTNSSACAGVSRSTCPFDPLGSSRRMGLFSVHILHVRGSTDSMAP